MLSWAAAKLPTGSSTLANVPEEQSISTTDSTPSVGATNNEETIEPAPAPAATTTTATSLPPSSLEVRLAALEAFVGKPSTPKKNDSKINGTTMTNLDDDVSSRLDSLQLKIKEVVPSSLVQSLEESNHLLTEFHPGPSLTYQKQPVGYRRQEVLASSENLQDGMAKLNLILDLLLISHHNRQKSKKENGSQKITEQDVVHAPILTLGVGDTFAMNGDSNSNSKSRGNFCSPQAERQLDLLLIESLQLQTMTEEIVGRVDTLVEDYNAIMVAAAEKTLLASEELDALEHQKDQQEKAQ